MATKRKTGISLATSTSVVPFLKWAGGKQWLAPRLTLQLMNGSDRYFEPFLGGGSVFFSARPKKAYLSDNNRDLINAYQVVRDNVEGLIKKLRHFTHSEDFYYRMRDAKPRTALGRAARLIYLNRTAWNGLYRVNREGRFNVPMGKFAYEPDIVRADVLRKASRALKGAKLQSMDFQQACRNVREGDVVYLDPPYTVTHNNNAFLRYNENIFSWEDQHRLARLAQCLDSYGAIVIISNAAHDAIVSLYEGFDIVKLDRDSLLAANATKRRSVSECLISNVKLASRVEL